jgi:hypothetical protein
LWPNTLLQFESLWTQYKQENGLLDFTDLIEKCLLEVSIAPNNPAVIHRVRLGQSPTMSDEDRTLAHGVLGAGRFAPLGRKTRIPLICTDTPEMSRLRKYGPDTLGSLVLRAPSQSSSPNGRAEMPSDNDMHQAARTSETDVLAGESRRICVTLMPAMGREFGENL